MHILPIESHTPETNMALDTLILDSYPEMSVPRFRHYGWGKPSWTFGYSQKWSIKHDLIKELAVEIIRRPTGGGLVDHLHDWTYSLVIPSSHTLYSQKPIVSYKEVHEALCSALLNQHSPCLLQEVRGDSGVAQNSSATDSPAPSDICFEYPESYDVIHKDGSKIAGSAQKRTKDGLLFQGSINRQKVGEINWDLFLEDFTDLLSEMLTSPKVDAPFPNFGVNLIEELSVHYSSEAWNKKR